MEAGPGHDPLAEALVCTDVAETRYQPKAKIPNVAVCFCVEHQKQTRLSLRRLAVQAIKVGNRA